MNQNFSLFEMSLDFFWFFCIKACPAPAGAKEHKKKRERFKK